MALLTSAALLLLVGCPAEQLGVELPRGGAEAISQEDLKRDAWLVEQAGTPAAAAEAVARRLGQMRLLPAFGSDWLRTDSTATVACGRKDGKDRRVQLVVAGGDPATAAGAITWAGAVSLAKGWDEPGVPARTRILCVAPSSEQAEALAQSPPVPVDQVAAVVLLGPLHGPALEVGSQAGPPPRWSLAAPGPEPSGVGAVDYRVVERNVREALGVVDGGD